MAIAAQWTRFTEDFNEKINNSEGGIDFYGMLGMYFNDRPWEIYNKNQGKDTEDDPDYDTLMTMCHLFKRKKK